MADIIESSGNKYVKEASQLHNARQRRKLGKFLLEGAAYIRDAEDSSLVEYLLVAASRLEVHRALCGRHDHRIVADKLLKAVCGTVSPQGIAAVCRQPNHDPDELAGLGGLLLVCEDVRDPGNLGAIIRTAAAAGASAVFALTGCTDAFSPKVVRASSGSALAVPVVDSVSTDEAMTLLRTHNIRVYAAHLQGTTLPYDADLSGSWALVIGNEARGVSPYLAGRCDTWLRLPMPGPVQSLNASVAAGILIYESLRQRIYSSSDLKSAEGDS